MNTPTTTAPPLATGTQLAYLGSSITGFDPNGASRRLPSHTEIKLFAAGNSLGSAGTLADATAKAAELSKGDALPIAIVQGAGGFELLQFATVVQPNHGWFDTANLPEITTPNMNQLQALANATFLAPPKDDGLVVLNPDKHQGAFSYNQFVPGEQQLAAIVDEGIQVLAPGPDPATSTQPTPAAH